MTYYGQLAREKLGQNTAGVGRPANAGIADSAAFSRNDQVVAINRLIATGLVLFAITFGVNAMARKISSTGFSGAD